MFDHSDFKSIISHETQKKIITYVDLLKSYNETTNIYSKTSYDKLPYHIYDSIQLAKQIQTSPFTIDMGSGSGLPGIIVAICNPNPAVCIESKLKKRAFLTQAKNALELSNLTIYEGDVQSYAKTHSGPKITSITAKAFAKPPLLVKYLSMFKKHQISTDVKCWVPISSDQLLLFKSDIPCITKVLADQEYHYMMLSLSDLKIYKAYLKNQYNL